MVNTAEFASHAEKSALRWYLQSLARELLPDERVAVCMRRKVPTRPTVDIHWKESGSAHYAHLQRCESVWTCAFCASLITEHRRRELSAGLDAAREKYLPMLVTWTLRHHQRQPLAGLLAAIRDTRRKIKSGRNWQYFRSEYLYVGSVSSLEVTYGGNGWHPHVHEIMFLDLGILDYQSDVQQLAQGIGNWLGPEWIRLLQKSGHDATLAHGVDVRSSFGDIAAYVAKWGKLPQEDKKNWTIAHEVAKAPSKVARYDGATPPQLLLEYGQGDKNKGRLFVEYATVFKGRAQLFWSKGMRDLLGLGAEMPESEQVNECRPDDYLLAQLQPDHWRVVLANNVRAELLDVASQGNPGKLWAYLDSLPGMEHTDRQYISPRIEGDPLYYWPTGDKL